MATAASPNVVGTLAMFAESRAGTIYEHYAERGGWEGWLQLEFLAMLRFRWADTGVERERHVYANNGEKADLLMHPSATFAYYTVIELKCESVLQDLTERHTGIDEVDSMTNFKRRLKSDIDKVQRGLNGGFKPAHCWVIGITRGANTAANPGLVDWGNYDVRFTTVGATDIIIWHWSREWIGLTA